MTRGEELLQQTAARHGQRMRLYLVLIGLSLLLLTITASVGTFAAVKAQQQSQTNAALIARLDRADVEQGVERERADELANKAVTDVLAANRQAADRRQRETLALLNESLRLLALEVRDPTNRAGRPLPTLPVPSPSPSPSPGPSPTPSP